MDPTPPPPSEAYRSRLRLVFGDTAWCDEPVAQPGPVTDAEDDRLAGLRRRVVEPVVAGMLRPHEVISLSVHWGVDGRDGDVWVCLDAPGDRYQDWLPSPWWAADPQEIDLPASETEIADHLADRLQDWIAESAFGWGELRRPDHRLPAE